MIGYWRDIFLKMVNGHCVFVVLLIPKKSYFEQTLGHLFGRATLLCNILCTQMHSNRFMDCIKPSKKRHLCLGLSFKNMSIPETFVIFFMQVKRMRHFQMKKSYSGYIMFKAPEEKTHSSRTSVFHIYHVTTNLS